MYLYLYFLLAVSSQEPHTPPGAAHEERPLMDLSVSTVHSMGSPLKEADLRRCCYCVLMYNYILVNSYVDRA